MSEHPPFAGVDVYLHGRCHIYALALAAEHGYEIRALWDLEPTDDDLNPGPTSLVHAYCRPPDGRVVDASGVHQEEDELLCGHGPCNEPDLVTHTPESIRALIRTRALPRPTRGEIAAIRDYLRRPRG